MEKFNLENLDKKDPFKVPEDYFEGLAEKIHQRILTNSLEDNHKHHLLKNIDKKSPFRTPEGYFEDFSEKLNNRISDKINQQEIKNFTPKPFYAKFNVYVKSLAIAAAVVLVGGFAYVIYENNQLKNQNNTENLLAFDDISNNEIVEYIQENHTETNENYILEQITETHITETHLKEINNTKEIAEDILKENPKEKPLENKDKINIINELPSNLSKEELQEMLNNGELEEEV